MNVEYNFDSSVYTKKDIDVIHDNILSDEVMDAKLFKKVVVCYKNHFYFTFVYDRLS